MNLLIATCIIAFAYIWGGGVGTWGESELWSGGWFFNALGHFIFGAGMSFALLYWAQIYFPETYVWTSKFVIAFIIFAAVNTLETDLWEGFERLWDGVLQPNFFPQLDKMQKGPDDTTLDIIITQLGCALALMAWGIYRKWFAKKYPDLAEKEEIERKKAITRLWGRSILASRKEHRKQIFQELRSAVRNKIKKQDQSL